MLYAERWAPAAEGTSALAVTVIEPPTGERRCFTLGPSEARVLALNG